MMEKGCRVSVSSIEWGNAAVRFDANERDGRERLDAMSSMSKGEGSMVGLDGGVMRAVSRLGFGILTHCTAAALHHAAACRLA